MSIVLVKTAPDGTEREFRLSKATTIVGSDSRCDIRIALPSIARRHCQISMEGDSAVLTELNTKSAVKHNGQRVREAVLSPEDTISIGPVEFKVRLAAKVPHVPEIDLKQQAFPSKLPAGGLMKKPSTPDEHNAVTPAANANRSMPALGEESA